MPLTQTIVIFVQVAVLPHMPQVPVAARSAASLMPATASTAGHADLSTSARSVSWSITAPSVVISECSNNSNSSYQPAKPHLTFHSLPPSNDISLAPSSTPPLHFSSLTKHLAKWKAELQNDIDALFLLDGITYGFKLIDFPIEEILPSDAHNYSSALSEDNKATLDKLFQSEIMLGRFTKQLIKPFRIQAIGAVPKKDSTVPRPITDCSRPFNNSLNEYLYADKFSFATIDQACLKSRHGYYYAIVDIESAYRWVPVFPPHTQLQGFRWKFNGEDNDSYYVDNYLCFGLSIAPAIFNRISCAIVRMIERAGHVCLSYLDDFLLIGDSYDTCRAALLYLIKLLIELGFAINWKKVVSPTTRVQFLGLIIDSLADRVELPQDKLDKLVAIASQYAPRTKLTKRELQVITGHMAFASRAIYGARPFTRLFIDAVNTLRRSGHKFRLGPVHKAELQWWTTFASTFNGLVPCSLGRHRPVVIVRTDASLSGFGAVKGTEWLAGFWHGIQPPAYLNIPDMNNLLFAPPLHASLAENINFLELLAAVIACLVWAPCLKGALVFIHSDNQSTVSYLKKCTTKNLPAISWLKRLFHASLDYDFRITAIHTPGITNVLPDALSRLADNQKYLRFFLSNFPHDMPAPNLPTHSFSPAFTQTGESC